MHIRLLIVFASLLVSSVATAQVIQACAHNRTGALRLVPDPSACRPGESAVSWNQEGPKGDPGEPGPPGVPVLVELAPQLVSLRITRPELVELGDGEPFAFAIDQPHAIGEISGAISLESDAIALRGDVAFTRVCEQIGGVSFPVLDSAIDLDVELPAAASGSVLALAPLLDFDESPFAVELTPGVMIRAFCSFHRSNFGQPPFVSADFFELDDGVKVFSGFTEGAAPGSNARLHVDCGVRIEIGEQTCDGSPLATSFEALSGKLRVMKALAP